MLRSSGYPTPSPILSISIAGLVLATALSTNAQLYFDNNGATAGSGTPGTSTWDAGTNWTTDPLGKIATSGWVDGSAAIFSAGTGAFGTWNISIGGTIQTNSITFNGDSNNTIHNITSGTIDAGASLLSIDASAAGSDTDSSKTIASVITGTGGLTIAANGDTSDTGGNSNSTFNLTGANTFTGGVTITSGIVGFPSNLGDVSNVITLNGGGFGSASVNLGGATKRNFMIGPAGGVLRIAGDRNSLTFQGAISGAGAISRTDSGIARFTGSFSGFSGNFNNNAGTSIFETNDSPTGAVNINAGTVLVGNDTATGSLAGASSISVAAGTTLAIRRVFTVNASDILPSAINFTSANSTLEYSPSESTSVFNLDRDLGVSATVGRLRITEGNFNLTSGTDVIVNSVSVGLQSFNIRGMLTVSDGSTLTTNYFGMGDESGQSGWVNQTGGAVTVLAAGNNFRIGKSDNGSNPGSFYDLSGGTLDTTATTAIIGDPGDGMIRVGGGPGVATWKVGVLLFSIGGTGTNVGQVIVSNNGVVEAYDTIGQSHPLAEARGIVLDGGTIRAMSHANWRAAMTANPSTTSTLDTNGFEVRLSNHIKGTGTINITGPGPLFFDVDSHRTIEASLAGTTPIIKVGSATANLTSDGTYSGTMTVNHGILAINGNYTAASVDVGVDFGIPGAVGGEGTIGSLFINRGAGALSVDANSPGSLTTANATFGPGALIRIGAYPLTGSTFTALKYTSALNGFSNLGLSDDTKYRSAILTDTGNSITVDIGTKDLVWNGATGFEWDTKTSMRWNTGEADQFAWGDRVRFDDTGTTINISLKGELRPASVVVDSDANNYTITGTVSDSISGSASLIKRGASTLTLNARNWYTGGTVISNGTIILGDIFGAGNGGTITLGDGTTGSNNVALLWSPTASGEGIVSPISVDSAGTGSVTIGTTNTAFGDLGFWGAMALNRPTTLTSGTSDRTIFYGGISGNVGTLTVNTTNNGSVAFGGNNSFVGDVVISPGATLQLGVVTPDGNYIPDASNITVHGTLNLAFANETINSLNGSGSIVAVNANNKLIVGAANGSGVFSGVISGEWMGVTKIGTGTQTLSGAANTYTGATTINGGALKVASLANGGEASPIGQSTNAAANLVISGGRLIVDGSSASSTDRLIQIGADVFGNTGEIRNNSTSPASTLTFTNPGTIAYGIANQPRTFTLSGSNMGNNTFAPSIRDNGIGPVAFVKDGLGKWILTGSNTYSSTTRIFSGTLQVGNGGATGQLGTGDVLLGINATLGFNRTGVASIAGALNSPTANAGTLNVDGGVALTLAKSGSFSGIVNVSNSSSLIFGAPYPTGAIDGGTDPADFNLGSGTTLTNTDASNHAHIGNITLSGATWTTGSGTGNYDGENYQLNGNVTVAGTSPSTISRNGTRTDADSGVSLNGQRTFTVANVTGNAATDLFIATQLEARDAGVVGGITKEGDGTMQLVAGPVHNYTGPTMVNAGNLLVNAVLSDTTTTVNGGMLSGAGTLAATTIASGGVLSPGLSIGTLNFSSILSLAGTAVFEIGKAGTTLSSDLANVTGLLTLGGNLNVIASGGALTLGDTFNLFDAGSFTGNFTTVNLPALGSGLAWDTRGLATGGSIAVVPEPGAAIALTGGIAFLIGLHRRRVNEQSTRRRGRPLHRLGR